MTRSHSVADLDIELHEMNLSRFIERSAAHPETSGRRTTDDRRPRFGEMIGLLISALRPPVRGWGRSPP